MRGYSEEDEPLVEMYAPVYHLYAPKADVETSRTQVRMFCLEVASRQFQGREWIRSEDIVNTAKKFEKYICGGPTIVNS